MFLLESQLIICVRGRFNIPIGVYTKGDLDIKNTLMNLEIGINQLHNLFIMIRLNVISYCLINRI
ncbi:hypothetical protein AsAng_0050240 [Aureispira anguillae]|uniref:Uncharacterized protein n=1 Tax=Aureispira anguillae TaxID=2864201 RepID=A0A916DW34_9BACT|nr:hypothetical protein AsAng_0050240 [Aureispira anguillae]